MEDDKKQVGLNESARLFLEAMGDKFFTPKNKTRSLLVISSDGEDICCGFMGEGAKIVDAVGSSMMSDEHLNNLMTMAFIAANGQNIINPLNSKFNDN